MPRPVCSDVLVLGGGVIGLSLADRLVRDGFSVTLVDRGLPGREASWAGAGVLPPASWYVDHPALDELCQAATPLHAELSERLREETGVDDQYAACGAEYQITAENRLHVEAIFARWRSLGVPLREEGDSVVAPGEAQVRNPRRLQALLASCQRQGVTILTDTEVTAVRRERDRIVSVETAPGSISAGAYCFAAGCWTPGLVDMANVPLSGRPVRGQMIVKRLAKPLPRIIHRYPYYAVPRRDGRVLIGATLEEAGFDKRTTNEAFEALQAAAAALHPALAQSPVEHHWAGLRPAAGDALPVIGPAPGLANAWLATGHHRSGLQLAPPTALILSAMLRGEAPPFAAAPFSPSRFATRRLALH